ncbi:MAG TPA: DUF4783 domain-containing protein [Luteibaculaceae bacterium]|nr:DUF4783 domain-containing protein [Luteibaculaceae bacterium]
MKRILFIVLVSLMASKTWAQQADVERINAALSTGNAAKLYTSFLPNIDLTIDEVDNLFSKEQAAQVLRRFFEQHAAIKFNVQHEGTSRSNDIYKIGTLETKSGTYRVTYFLKKEGSAYLIKELRLER